MTEIRSAIDPTDLGQTLVERAVDVHHVDGIEIVSRWYHSPMDCDLMVWLDAENELIRFQFNISGQVVDWNRANGFRTGLIVETECQSGGQSQAGASDAVDRSFGHSGDRTTAETIRFDHQVALSAVRLAQAVFLAADSIRPRWRERVVRLLNYDGSVSPLKASSRRHAPRSRFWRRLRGWVVGA
ncbi:MAG: hypothetical protein U1E10_16980 [Bdellovibrionales bacterium]|nr:hypothetical protein [Bdellovibrionales bacterium]